MASNLDWNIHNQHSSSSSFIINITIDHHHHHSTSTSSFIIHHPRHHSCCPQHMAHSTADWHCSWQATWPGTSASSSCVTPAWPSSVPPSSWDCCVQPPSLSIGSCPPQLCCYCLFWAGLCCCSPGTTACGATTGLALPTPL